MIETLIEAERALTHGRVDEAERLYRQVAGNDPKSSIAVMGLARVALERGDDRTAYVHGRAALAIDPDNPAAQHLVMRLAEVMAGRGETPPSVDATPGAETPRAETPPDALPAGAPPPRLAAEPAGSAPVRRPAKKRSTGIIGRLLGRRPRPR
jgi:Tetratricopeptide repeat